MIKPTSFIAVLFCGWAAGCSTVITHQADLAQKPQGVRIYPPQVYLLVDAAERKSTLAYLPDFQRAYDVKPLTILAKQDFKVELDEGQLKSLTDNQDTAGFISLIKEGASTAAKAAGVAVSSTIINGTFGLSTGIYRLDDHGVFRRVQPE